MNVFSLPIERVAVVPEFVLEPPIADRCKDKSNQRDNFNFNNKDGQADETRIVERPRTARAARRQRGAWYNFEGMHKSRSFFEMFLLSLDGDRSHLLIDVLFPFTA